MKGLNIKKLAAIATGAALLGSAALPLVGATSISKEDIYSSSGSPKVNIVVGSAAQVSDAIWAGNLAAKIAEKAATSGTVAVTGSAGEAGGAELDISDLTVDVTIGGTVTFGAGSKEYKVNLVSTSGSTKIEVPNANDTNSLSDAQLPHLYNASKSQKVDNNNTTPTLQEKIGVNVDAKFDTSSDIKDLVSYIEGGDFYYEVVLNGSNGIDLGSTTFTDGTDDNVKIVFFGEEYELSSASLSGSPNIKLVKSSAKESYNEGETIEGLVGDNQYGDEEVSVKVVQIVQTGAATTTYSGTFELYDAEGNLIDTQTVASGSNLRDVFKSSKGNEALRSNLFLDTIAVGSTTGVGYVEITKGTDTLLLYDTKGYPYDSTDTSGIYDYVVGLTVTGTTKLQKIKITNSREKWNNSSATKGPLYPTNSGQSLNGKSGNTAVFGDALEEGTLGKGFAKAEFLGFEAKEELTTVTIGNSVGSLDSSAKGGINFRGFDDAEHNVPFSLELDDSETGSTFSFDGKTIWYDVNYGVSSSAGANNDLNFTVNSLDVINGRGWTITDANTSVGNDENITISVEGVGAFPLLLMNSSFVVDDVNYVVADSNNGTALSVNISVDGEIIFKKDNSTGTLLYNTATTTLGTGNATTDNAYSRMYFTDGKTFDGNSISATTVVPVNIGLPGNGDRKVYYAVRTGQTINRLWMLLDADILGSDETSTIQNSKVMSFLGTTVPTDSSYTETKGISSAFESGAGNINGFVAAGATARGYGYYVPQDTDFNSSDAYSNSLAYFVAYFSVTDNVSNGDFNVYIDTKNAGNIGSFTNSNLSAHTSDADFNGTPTFSLKSGSDSSYLTAGYSDAGSKAWLIGSDSGVKISMPENRQKIQIVISGTDVQREVTGDTISGLALNETGTTDSGTKVTVTAVNGGSCVASGSAPGTCVANPATYWTQAPVANPIVYVDTDAPSGTNIIIGGHIVNKLAKSLSDELTAPGSVIARTDPASGNIFVAGYTASDTGNAVQDLIDDIDSWA